MARRRVELTPQAIQQLETMSGLGLTVEQMSAVLGMSKKTLERRMGEVPGAKDALEKGRALAALNVTTTAFKLATSGESPAMTMFWLKCRERWKEVHTISLEDPDGRPAFSSLADMAAEAARLSVTKTNKRRDPSGG